MKKTISYLLVLPILMAYMAACNDDTYKHFVLETPPDTMQMSALKDTITLNEELDSEIALTLRWNKAADRGEGTAITYYFKMDIANNGFATSIPKREINPDQLSVSFTNKELNDLIIAYWKMHPGGTVDLEAEIIADVTTYPQFLKPEISKTMINVTSYAPKPRDLFLSGSAIEDPLKTRLTTLTINKEYTWTGNLKAGTYKFTEKPNEPLPSYNKGNDTNSLVYRTEESEPDELFTVTKAGTYALYVNIETMITSCTPVPYPQVYMVGNATPADWIIENSILLKWDYTRAAYVYEGELKTGEMKCPLEKNWSANTLMPVEPGADPLTDNRMELVPGGNPDKKWTITQAGMYRMILDVSEMTITLEKLE